MKRADSDLDRLVAAVQGSPKHGRIAEEVIRRVGAEELPKRRSLKEAIKATKNKLHQVGGAYLEGGVSYDRWLDSLHSAAGEGEGPLRDACREVMRRHASTAERLAILDTFYKTTLADLGPIDSVLDVACGLNPLAIPWLPLAPGAAYYACDIYQDMLDFLNAFFPLVEARGRAEVCNASQGAPPIRAQVALILKTIPCLEQLDKSAGLRLLESAQADWLLVSFPVRSLGGANKGMVASYDAHMSELLAGKDWPFQRFEFETELAYRIDKRGAGNGA